MSPLTTTTRICGNNGVSTHHPRTSRIMRPAFILIIPRPCLNISHILMYNRREHTQRMVVQLARYHRKKRTTGLIQNPTMVALSIWLLVRLLWLKATSVATATLLATYFLNILHHHRGWLQRLMPTADMFATIMLVIMIHIAVITEGEVLAISPGTQVEGLICILYCSAGYLPYLNFLYKQSPILIHIPHQ